MLLSVPTLSTVTHYEGQTQLVFSTALISTNRRISGHEPQKAFDARTDVTLWWAVQAASRRSFIAEAQVVPRPVHVRFVVGEVALGQIFLPLVWFSLLVVLQQCCMLIFIPILLSAGQAGEAWEL